MAEFDNNTKIDKDNRVWHDITGEYSGKTVMVQNQGNSKGWFFLGAETPEEMLEGIVIPPFNWPLVIFDIETKLWFRGGSTRIHISEVGSLYTMPIIDIDVGGLL